VRGFSALSPGGALLITKEEQEVFDEFCKLTGQNPADYDHPDPPDCLSKDRKVAVELAGYHRDLPLTGGSAQRKAEETAKELASKAEQEFLQRATQRMDAVLYIRPKAHIYPIEKRAREITDLVLRHQGQTVDIEADGLPESLREILSCILVAPTSRHQVDPLWQYIEAANARVVPSAVQTLLNRKEEKLPSYRNRSTQACLLIHASPHPCVGIPNQVNPSRCGIITNELREWTFLTSFDRVYYLDRQRIELIEMKIKAP
jgi:hypothetical protein